MTNTETEAKTKWCPHMRQPACMPDGTSVAVNFLPADNGPDSRGNCIASECMAWRWAKRDSFGDTIGEGRSTTEGYCGLAGAP